MSDLDRATERRSDWLAANPEWRRCEINTGPTICWCRLSDAQSGQRAEGHGATEARAVMAALYEWERRDFEMRKVG